MIILAHNHKGANVTSLISTILVGILSKLGWQKLIVQILEDLFYYLGNKVSNVLAQEVLKRIGDSLKELEGKE